MATTYAYCPHCGVANAWTPPEMHRMLDYLKTGLDLSAPYNWTREGPLLAIHVEPKTTPSRRQQAALLLLLILPLSILGFWATPAMVWGMGAAELALVLVLVRRMRARSKPQEKVLIVDYSQDQPSWHCTDPNYFQPVLKKMGLVNKS